MMDDCYCDVEYRCPNHDLDAEVAYWAGRYYGSRHASAPELDERWAYERTDPKHPEYLAALA